LWLNSFPIENEIAVKSDDSMDFAQVLSSHGKPMDYLFSVYNNEVKKGEKKPLESLY